MTQTDADDESKTAPVAVDRGAHKPEAGNVVTLPLGEPDGPRLRFRVKDVQVWPLAPGDWFCNPWGYAQKFPQDPPAKADQRKSYEAIPLTVVDRLELVPQHRRRPAIRFARHRLQQAATRKKNTSTSAVLQRQTPCPPGYARCSHGSRCFTVVWKPAQAHVLCRFHTPRCAACGVAIPGRTRIGSCPACEPVAAAQANAEAAA